MASPAKPAPPERLANGAVLAWSPWPVAKYVIFDCWGNLAGYRREVAAAREFAAGLPGSPQEPEAPRPISRSPRALPLPEEKVMPAAPPTDERPEFFRNKSMSPWRARHVGRPGE